MKLLVGLVSAVLAMGMMERGAAEAQTMAPPGSAPAAQPAPAPAPVAPQQIPAPAAQQPPPPQGYYPPPQGYYPPPQGYYPPPQGYYPVQQGPQLTAEEQELLSKGEISTGQVVLGVLASGWLDLGLGQAVQGRWSDTGWIFTVGEPLMLTVALSSAISCDASGCEGGSRGLLVGSLLGYFGLRVWSIVDTITGPSDHNRRLRLLHMKLGMMPPIYSRVTPYLLPASQGSGATAGLSLRF